MKHLLFLAFCPRTHCLRGLSTVVCSSFTTTAGASSSLETPIAFLQKHQGKQSQFCRRTDWQLQQSDKTWKLNTFWLQSTSVGVPHSPRPVLPGGPAHVGGLFSRRRKPMRHCSPVSRSRQLGFGVFSFFFLKKNWHFSVGKHTFFPPECFPFKIKTEVKWNLFWQEGGKKKVLADCVHAIFGLTHGRWVSVSLLRSPVHHRRLPGRRKSGWQTLSTCSGWRQWIERWNQDWTLFGPCSRRREEQWWRLLQDKSELFLRKRGKALLQIE